jgi:uncharacterized lipoprotein YajG
VVRIESFGFLRPALRYIERNDIVLAGMKAAILLILSAGLACAQQAQPLLLAPIQPIQPVAVQQPTANQAVSQILSQMSRQQSELQSAAALTGPPTVIRYVPQQPVFKAGK